MLCSPLAGTLPAPTSCVSGLFGERVICRNVAETLLSEIIFRNGD